MLLPFPPSDRAVRCPQLPTVQCPQLPPAAASAIPILCSSRPLPTTTPSCCCHSHPLTEPSAAHSYSQLLTELSAVHSYSQLLLLPFGFSDDRPSDYRQLLRVAKRGRRQIFSAAGTWFKVGQPSRRLYPVSGISQDWAKAVAGVKYSYSFELRDKGKYGLLLPASQIEQSGKEILEGVTVHDWRDRVISDPESSRNECNVTLSQCHLYAATLAPTAVAKCRADVRGE